MRNERIDMPAISMFIMDINKAILLNFFHSNILIVKNIPHIKVRGYNIIIIGHTKASMLPKANGTAIILSKSSIEPSKNIKATANKPNAINGSMLIIKFNILKIFLPIFLNLV